MNLTDEQLDAMRAELKARLDTAEQEIHETEQLKDEVAARQGIISRLVTSLTAGRAENHFGENYKITMRTRNA